jgi:hypothetical protein
VWSVPSHRGSRTRPLRPTDGSLERYLYAWDEAIARAVWGLGFVLATVSVTLSVIVYVVDRAAGHAPGAKEDASRARRHLARRPRKDR